MNYLKYDKFFDNPPLYENAEKNTLIIRLEGNIGEERPDDMHRYDITLPAEVGDYTVDFTSYTPKHRYCLRINSVNENSVNITFNEKDYTLHEGVNFLFDERNIQASYDGPWFTGVDEFKAIWLK